MEYIIVVILSIIIFYGIGAWCEVEISITEDKRRKIEYPERIDIE